MPAATANYWRADKHWQKSPEMQTEWPVLTAGHSGKCHQQTPDFAFWPAFDLIFACF